MNVSKVVNCINVSYFLISAFWRKSRFCYHLAEENEELNFILLSVSVSSFLSCRTLHATENQIENYVFILQLFFLDIWLGIENSTKLDNCYIQTKSNKYVMDVIPIQTALQVRNWLITFTTLFFCHQKYPYYFDPWKIFYLIHLNMCFWGTCNVGLIFLDSRKIWKTENVLCKMN